MANQEEKLLNVTDAAKRLQISPNTLRRWTDEGLIRVVRLPSGHRRFEPLEIERKRRELGFSDGGREA